MHLEDRIDELKTDISNTDDRVSTCEQLIKMLLVGRRVKLFQARGDSFVAYQRVTGKVSDYDDRDVLSDTEHGTLRSELWEVMEILDEG